MARRGGTTGYEELIPGADRVEELRLALVGWYRQVKRDLPWRRTSDAYAIWVSEIMLQQTQVETVKPYYHRFLDAFPTVEALAAAPEQEVLTRWAGLGYYARARNLQRGAQVVVREYGGRVPDDLTALRRIPGIGPYTAGAIASIAYGRAEPILDGNVARVLSRVFHLTEDPRGTTGQKALWALAGALVPEGAASDFNQGLMELGALVCVPGAPRCEVCPLADGCEARRRGDAAELPTRGPEKARPLVELVALILERGGTLLVARRPARGLFGGLWEFPMLTRGGGPAEIGEAPRTRGRLHAPAVVSGLDAQGVAERGAPWRTGLGARAVEALDPEEHQLTHLSLRVHPVRCEAEAGPLAPRAPAHVGGPLVVYEEWRWVEGGALAELPVGALTARLLKRLGRGQMRLF